MQRNYSVDCTIVSLQFDIPLRLKPVVVPLSVKNGAAYRTVYTPLGVEAVASIEGETIHAANSILRTQLVPREFAAIIC